MGVEQPHLHQPAPRHAPKAQRKQRQPQPRTLCTFVVRGGGGITCWAYVRSKWRAAMMDEGGRVKGEDGGVLMWGTQAVRRMKRRAGTRLSTTMTMPSAPYWERISPMKSSGSPVWWLWPYHGTPWMAL